MQQRRQTAAASRATAAATARPHLSNPLRRVQQLSQLRAGSSDGGCQIQRKIQLEGLGAARMRLRCFCSCLALLDCCSWGQSPLASLCVPYTAVGCCPIF